MGSSICSPNNVEAEFHSNPLDYAFGEDDLESRIPHEDTIKSRVKQIEQILNDCQQKLKISQKLYKDPSMKSDPVILRSLSSKDSQVKCTFQRPYVFLNDPTTGRGKKYKILDFADCKSSQIIIKDEVLQYFGVFLCFLAENPHLINQIILADANTYGIYAFRMNIGSKKQFIYTDDYILCCDRTPLFSQPIKGIYMWPCLLQKAWFKVKGNIGKKIEKINPQQVFNTFLSYPMKPYLFKPNDEEYNLKLIKDQIYNLTSQNGCVITTKKQPLHKIGLSGRKHFYLLKCFNFNGKMLYYLRNPCFGSLDFRGSHRVISQQLVNRIKQLTGQLKIPQGNFILEQDQLLQQVQQFFIIHYNKSSQIVSQQQITLDEGEQFFISTEIKNEGLVSMCFSQQPNNSLERPFSPLIYHVISLNQKEVVSDQRNDQGCFGVRNTYLLENVCQNLKPGEYLIRLKKKRLGSKNNKKETVSDRIIITAPFKVKFDYKQLSLTKQRFIDFLKFMGKQQIIKRSNVRKSKQDFEHKSFWVGDLVIVYVQKTNPSKKQIRVQVQFSQLKNLQCINHQLKKQFTAIDPFQTSLIFIFEKIDLIEQTVLGKYIIESF